MKRFIVVIIVLSFVVVYGCQSRDFIEGPYVPFGEFNSVLDTRTGVVWMMHPSRIGDFWAIMSRGEKPKKIEWVQMTEPIPIDK